MTEESIWRHGLKLYYGASACRNWKQLSVDIECVAVGLKPAYLLDTLAPDPPHRFHSFLNYVLLEISKQGDPNRSAAIQRWLGELRVVALGSAVLVLNKTSVGEMFHSSSQTCVYVDISKAETGVTYEQNDAHINIHTSSAVEKQCKEWYGAMVASEQQQTESSGRENATDVKLLSVPPLPEMNVCTLFGRLLGYPAVYWFPPSADYTLDFVNLVRHKVTISQENHKVSNHV